MTHQLVDCQIDLSSVKGRRRSVGANAASKVEFTNDICMVLQTERNAKKSIKAPNPKWERPTFANAPEEGLITAHFCSCFTSDRPERWVVYPGRFREKKTRRTFSGFPASKGNAKLAAMVSEVDCQFFARA